MQYLSNLVRDSIEEVREISYNLHPHQLERLGLKKALESAVKKAANASKINFDFVIDDIDDLFSENSKIYFFRIIQEAITNIIKHANATKASLYIERNSDYLMMTIADNGKGFNIKNYSAENLPTAGLGLSNIAERVKLLKGKLKIRSNPEEGTVIQVNIPIGEFQNNRLL